MILFNSECYLCQLKRHMETARTLGDEETATAFCRALMQMYLDAPENTSSPGLGPEISALYQKFYGLDEDRYKEEKQQANAFVLARMDDIRSHVEAAPDRLKAALQCAILGNYLDFAVLQKDVSFEKLDTMLAKIHDIQIDAAVFEAFRQELQTGKKLLYLTDNAGEIGFDRIFAEEIARKYPHLEITFCVRGDIIINDATRADAEAVGIPFPVIDNGNRVPGTQIDLLGQEAKAALDAADVILAKGMANCETMHGCGYNVYYAFLVKCQRFVDRFQKPMLTPMLVKERT